MTNLRSATLLLAASLFFAGCAADHEDLENEDDVGETAAALSTSCASWWTYSLGKHTIDGLYQVIDYTARPCITKNNGTAKSYVEYKLSRSSGPKFLTFDVKVELQRRKTRIGFDSTVDSVVCHIASRANDTAAAGTVSGTCSLGAINATSGYYYSSDGSVKTTFVEDGKEYSDSANIDGSPVVKF